MKYFWYTMSIQLIVQFGQGNELDCMKPFISLRCTLDCFNKTSFERLSTLSLTRTQHGNYTRTIAIIKSIKHAIKTRAIDFMKEITFETNKNESSGIYIKTRNITDVTQFGCVLEIRERLNNVEIFKTSPLIEKLESQCNTTFYQVAEKNSSIYIVAGAVTSVVLIGIIITVISVIYYKRTRNGSCNHCYHSNETHIEPIYASIPARVGRGSSGEKETITMVDLAAPPVPPKQFADEEIKEKKPEYEETIIKMANHPIPTRRKSIPPPKPKRTFTYKLGED